jgi:hypothetical protein
MDRLNFFAPHSPLGQTSGGPVEMAQKQDEDVWYTTY